MSAHTPSSRGRWISGSLLAILAALPLAVSCALDLDESRIGEAIDGGDDAPQPILPEGDGGDSGPPPVSASCTRDDECTSTHGCLKGRCDLSRKLCVYDVCKVAACTSKVCDVGARVCTGADALYKYKTGEFSIGTTISRSRDFAAVYPYVFFLTGAGVLAFNVSNPAIAPNTTPPAVDVVGLGFLPSQLVASGGRVYLIGNPAGSPQPSRVPLAWIDVPADPLTKKLVAQSVLATTNRPEGSSLFPASDGQVLLVGPQAASYPSALIKAPFVEPFAVNSNPIPVNQGSEPAAVSGTRVVMRSLNGEGISSLGFINGPGTPGATNAGSVALPDAGPMAAPQWFLQSPEGAIFWLFGALTGTVKPVPPPPEPPPTQPNLRAARGIFVVPDANGNFDVAPAIDVETYRPEVSREQTVLGPSAMLDANTAIVAVAANENVNQSTAVQFVRRNPLEIVKEGTNPRRHVIGVPIGAFVAAAGSNGIGYLVANTGTPPQVTSTVYVFDPGCPL